MNEDKSRRIRVLFIHQSGGRGGAGTMLANIIAAMDQKRFAPIVVCPKGDGNEQLISVGATVRVAARPIYQFLHSTGSSRPVIHPYFLRPAIMQRWHRGYWREYIREIGADIVCLNALTLAPMAVSARQAGARVLCVVQETTVRGWLGMRTRWLYRLLSRWTDAVVFISEHDRARADCRAPLTEVIPNWVNRSDFDRNYPMERARRELDIPASARVVLMMGGIDRLKGTLPLLRAAARLSDIAGLMVVIAGDSAPLEVKAGGVLSRCAYRLRRWPEIAYRQEVLKFISDHKLTERIRFIGMQAEVARLYAVADVVVFPATKPHQARPVIEAGAMARPVVLPDFPSTREFVQHGLNGLTYRPGNVEGLAQHLRTLLLDREMARNLGENNYRNTHRLHDGEINGARFRRVFLQLAAMTGSR